ncbi:MAG: hypothetical protein ACI4M9_08475 [Succinivibrio sp.]
MENEDFNQDLKIEDKPFTLAEKKQFQEVIGSYSLMQLNEAKLLVEERITEIQDRMQDIEKVINLMKELNISFADMKRLGYKIPVLIKNKRSASSTDRYRIVTESGVSVKWSGRGRKPVAFASIEKEDLHLYRIQEDGMTEYEKINNIKTVSEKFR